MERSLRNWLMSSKWANTNVLGNLFLQVPSPSSLIYASSLLTITDLLEICMQVVPLVATRLAILEHFPLVAFRSWIDMIFHSSGARTMCFHPSTTFCLFNCSLRFAFIRSMISWFVQFRFISLFCLSATFLLSDINMARVTFFLPLAGDRKMHWVGDCVHWINKSCKESN